MSVPLWVNVMLGVPFLLVWVGIPLWMTLKSPDTPPDFSAARAYLNALNKLVALGDEKKMTPETSSSAAVAPAVAAAT